MTDQSDREWSMLPANIALKSLLIAMGIGLFCVLLYAFQSVTDNFFGVAFSGILLSGASIVMGAGLGFLFGIPRTLQPGEPATNESENANTSYRANTNLEQISDWLTKIIVGVGLTQLLTFDDKLREIGKSIAPALGNDASSPVAAVSILLFFSASGFFFGFLWTRLYLAKAFRHADTQQLARRIDNTEKQIELNTRAVNLVTEQIESPQSNLEQDALNQAVKSASKQTRVQIAHLAVAARSRAYNRSIEKDRSEEDRGRDKAAIARTTPVFRALIHADERNQYHQNHAELAFALKDQSEPDLLEAENELTQAIAIRNQDASSRPHQFYELVRAICRISRDGPGKSTSTERRDEIRQDLRYASTHSRWAATIKENAEIQEWMKANDVSEEALTERSDD